MTHPRWCPRPGCGVELRPGEKCLEHQDRAAYDRVNRLAAELLKRQPERGREAA